MNSAVTNRQTGGIVIPLLYFAIFFFFFGENIQQAPRTKIYETILCLQQGIIPAPGTERENPQCKVSTVQSELAALKGLERLFGIIPIDSSAILAVPYGILADHYGHVFIMSLALLGVLLEESWPFLVCGFADRIPVRFILMGPIFEMIGGGTAMSSTMMHVVATRNSTDENRTFVFWSIRAISIASAVIAEGLGGFLMAKSAWLTWLVGLVSLFLSFITSLLISRVSPQMTSSVKSNTSSSTSVGYGTIRTQNDNDADVSTTDAKTSMLLRSLHILNEIKQGFGIVLCNIPLLVLLGAAFFAQLSDDASPMVLLLYITGRYHWSYSNATFLSAIADSIQFVVLVIILPYVRVYLVTSRKWAGYQCDLIIAVVGVYSLTLGTLMLGLGSSIKLAIIGLVLTSSAGGVQASTRSLITDQIREEDINIVYSVFTILQRISSALAGPMYSWTYAVGVKMDGYWLGLPFFFASMTAAISTVMLHQARSPSNYQLVPLGGIDAESR